MARYGTGDDTLWRTVEEIVSLGPRWTGEEAERKAAKYLTERLFKAGFKEVQYERFQVRTWKPISWHLKCMIGCEWEEITSYPVWYCGSKGEESFEADAVFCGHGFDRDFQGVDLKGKIGVFSSKILLNYYPTHSLLGTYHRAQELGAVGYVALLDGPDGLLPRYNHLHEDEPPGEIPGLVVTGTDAHFIEHVLKQKGGKIRIKMKLLAQEGIGETGDVIARLPGRSNRWVIVATHYDSTSPGAVDNAAANALWLHLAEQTAAAVPSKGILWVAHPGHEVNIGAREFIKRHEDLLPKIDCYLSLDGASSIGHYWWREGVLPSGRDEQRGINCSSNPLLLKAAIGAALKHGLEPIAYVSSDQTIFNRDMEGRFYERGVPYVIMIGKPIFYHTEQDTLDKVDPRALVRSLGAHRALLQEILEMPSQEIVSADRSLTSDNLEEVVDPRLKSPSVHVLWSCVPEVPFAGSTAIFSIRHFDAPGTCILDVHWDFGDGQEARGPAVPHVFERQGRYMVRLTLRDASGKAHQFERPVWVSD